MKLFSIFSPLVAGHSWIACTDYAEKNAAYYDQAKCRGYPRAASRYAAKGVPFGSDRGYDHRPNGGTSPCKSPRSDNDYVGGHHRAIYFPGQQVILAHPMKNHGTGPCTNPYIPDNGNWIFAMGETEVGSPDPVLSEFKKNEIIDLGKSETGNGAQVNKYPKVGFQNAPAFCENTDKALGTYSFNVPVNMEPGDYTFVWLWAFNHATDYYSTCFEVTIAANVDDRKQKMEARGQTDFTLICEKSKTSTGDFGSNAGCKDGDGQVIPTEGPKPTVPTPPPQTTLPPAPVDGSFVLVNQLTGRIILPGPDEPPKSREIHVKFYADCGEVATPNFWYARLDYVHNEKNQILQRFRRSDGGGKHSQVIHYILQQENADDIKRGYVGFHWAFDGGCQMLDYPTDVHVIDTLLEEE